MQKSASISSIAKALITFRLKVGTIKKDAKNPFFKSTYASLSNILDAIDTPLNESGLSFCQFPTDQHGLTTILMHGESGEWIESNYQMKPTKDDPQGLGSALTYQRRYALAAVLGLNIDDDDDGNAASKTEKKQDQSDNKPWLNENTKEFTGAVEKLRNGTTTIEKIKSVLKISKAVEEKLKQLSTPQNN